MPSDYINNPKHWLDRAAETRALAASMIDGGIKTAVLRLARLTTTSLPPVRLRGKAAKAQKEPLVAHNRLLTGPGNGELKGSQEDEFAF